MRRYILKYETHVQITFRINILYYYIIYSMEQEHFSELCQMGFPWNCLKA